jgi:hypothetical protein
MEIQRQASMMPHYSSLVWLDQFVQTRALEENMRYQQVPERNAPFENLYHDLARTAVKNNERCQPLQCPNFPRLPQKKSKHRASKSNRVSRSNDTSPIRYQSQSNNLEFPSQMECQAVQLQLKQNSRCIPTISFTTKDNQSHVFTANNAKVPPKSFIKSEPCMASPLFNTFQTEHRIRLPQNETQVQLAQSKGN